MNEVSRTAPGPIRVQRALCGGPFVPSGRDGTHLGAAIATTHPVGMTTTSDPPPAPDGARPPTSAPKAPRPADDLVETAVRSLSWRADCCSAPAPYRIVFRRGATAGPAELYLCGHHYRASTATLLALQASVYDERGRLLASSA